MRPLAIIGSFFLVANLMQVQGLISAGDFAVLPPTIPGSTRQSVEVKRNPLKCACDEGSADTVICASNGITYKSLCRFNCAKQKVKRLRKVKEGSCDGRMQRKDFWKPAE
ncbi:unnamed protein product [Allacma fusca]|uniref:Kazal-like domain-containing protein n=1 Tax=Allacma fusca TaxID=39272 RepID=A0A8J2J6J2_9HEXA|nr:unnamed protein product [Allacma fusca]